MKKNRLLLICLLLLFSSTCIAGENDSLSIFRPSKEVNKKRIHLLNYTVAGLYPATMSWLYTQWYQDYPQSKFHLFNDNHEWLQMDKYGHFWDAYSISKPLYQLYRWGGYSNKRSTLTSCGIAFLYQSTVEVFDGFSSEWGFSFGDVACNTGGVLLFGVQQLTWEEQRIKLKYSFHQTQFSKYRPNVLGSNLPENILKDYNGLTYWISANAHSFLPEGNSFPKWLGLAVGFGADGMIGGTGNPGSIDGKIIPHFDRFRQYYLSLDIDLTKIKTRSRFLNGMFQLINIIHMPAPALEFSPGKKVIGRLLYF